MEDRYASDIVIADKKFRIFITRDRIMESIERMAAMINADYAGGSKGIPLFIGVLNGAFMFFGELMQRIVFPCEVSFIKVASYSGMHSMGSVSEVIGLREDLVGRHVVLVEDIVDSGVTISALKASLEAMHPASVEVASLLLKPSAYRGSVSIKYVAMEVPDDFIVGFGLDYMGLGRNLKHLYIPVDEK